MVCDDSVLPTLVSLDSDVVEMLLTFVLHKAM